ncbi:hypothetical protein RJ639_034446 [Escallonia herrerae]|uniref:PABC domain-containing protein n=1 Tax=Escallonia herrerae TaxID=1293975 RepID=A0AA89BKY2_9ASTE|nr:hypothetical protein RJ639_034446 [Escallonia herrerae]
MKNSHTSPREGSSLLGARKLASARNDYLGVRASERQREITSMLLEMDQIEALPLLDSLEALKAKVVEAMDILRNDIQQQQANTPADQLASLSLNDGLVPSSHE